jgi:hypothetical protein
LIARISLFRCPLGELIAVLIVAPIETKGAGTMKKLLLGAALVVAATSVAAAQGYYYATPYGYGLYGTGNFPGLYAYVGEPNAGPPVAYDGGVYGTARNWQYYRSHGPGRGNNEESTR